MKRMNTPRTIAALRRCGATLATTVVIVSSCATSPDAAATVTAHATRASSGGVAERARFSRVPPLGTAAPRSSQGHVFAAPPGSKPTQDLQKVIGGVRNLLVGLLVSLATLFLVIAGILYIAAGGDMRSVENAKTALKSAVVGYLVAGIATFIVEALQSVIPK